MTNTSWDGAGYVVEVGEASPRCGLSPMPQSPPKSALLVRVPRQHSSILQFQLHRPWNGIWCFPAEALGFAYRQAGFDANLTLAGAALSGVPTTSALPPLPFLLTPTHRRRACDPAWRPAQLTPSSIKSSPGNFASR